MTEDSMSEPQDTTGGLKSDGPAIARGEAKVTVQASGLAEKAPAPAISADDTTPHRPTSPTGGLSDREGRQRVVAAAIANARGNRRGVPVIVNILDILPAKLRDEVMDDADAVLDALDGVQND